MEATRSGSSSSGSRPLLAANRREKDAAKLMKAGLKVELIEDSIYNMRVELDGPPGSPYHGFKWRVIIELPEGYPRIPPVVHFEDSIYHPNIDLDSGYICASFLDNEKWNPDTELSAIILHFLPSLLIEPNAGDPYNQGAAELLERNKKEFEKMVEDYSFQHGKPT